MLTTAIVALTTFFATVAPVDLGPTLAALTPDATPRQRRAIALRATLTAAGILLLFALFGNQLMHHLGISLAALRIAGGILLLVLGIDLVFGKDGEAQSAQDSVDELRPSQDVAVFPLAIPLISGPGSIGAMLLLIAETKGDMVAQLVVIGAMLVVLTLSLLIMFLASPMQRLVGKSGLHMINRIVGVLLAALAVQFVIDGIVESGLF